MLVVVLFATLALLQPVLSEVHDAMPSKTLVTSVRSCLTLPSLPSELETFDADGFMFHKSPPFPEFLSMEAFLKVQKSHQASSLSWKIGLRMMLDQVNSFEETILGFLEQAEDHLNAMFHDPVYSAGVVTDYLNDMEMLTTLSKTLILKSWWGVFSEHVLNYLRVKLTLDDQIPVIRKIKVLLSESIEISLGGNMNHSSLKSKLTEIYKLIKLLDIFGTQFTERNRMNILFLLSFMKETKDYYLVMENESDSYIIHCADNWDSPILINQIRKLVNPIYLSTLDHPGALDSLLREISESVNREDTVGMSTLKRATDWFIEDVEINQRIQQIYFFYESLYVTYLKSIGISKSVIEVPVDDSFDVFVAKMSMWKSKLVILENEDLYHPNITVRPENFIHFHNHFQSLFAQMTDGRSLEDWFLSDDEWKALKEQRKRKEKNRAKKQRQRLKRKGNESGTVSIGQNQDVQEEIDENVEEIMNSLDKVELRENQVKSEETHENYDASEYEVQFAKDREAKLLSKSKTLTSTLSSPLNQARKLAIFDQLDKDDCQVARAIYQGGNDLPWTQFVSFMNKLGASIESMSYTAGSNKKFKWPGKEFPSMNFHKPHPKEKFQKYQLQAIKRRFMKTMGWTFETFEKCH